MDFFGVVKQRRSIRAFQSKPIEEQKLQRILESINQAPSAGNLQAFEVYLVRDVQRSGPALVKATLDQEFMAQAAVVLVFCTHAKRAEARYGERGMQLYSLQDATIACTYAMLAAAALGLSSVWVGKFDEAAVTELAGIPDGQRPVALLPIGYAAESPHAPARRALSDLIHEVN
jgi:nitroreductase